MTQFKNLEKKLLYEVKRQIIDRALIVSSIMGTLAFGLTIIGRLGTGFSYISAIELSLLLSLIITTLRRNHLSNDFKTTAIISLILLFSFSDAFHFGLFSSSRVYLILVPFFSIFYFSLNRTLLVFIGSILGFVIIGYLHHLQLLTLPDAYVPEIYLLRFYPWIINAVHISIVGSIILLISRKFLNAFSGMITELEESNKQIADRELNYREIFNSTNEAIILHNASDGKILDVNDVMLRMFGIESKEKALKLKVKDITLDEGGITEQKAQQLIKKAVDEGPQVFEWKSRKMSGEWFFSEISLKSTEIGGYGRVLAVVRDITERKNAQKALEESERKFREMAELLPETVWECDIDGIVSFVNKHGLKQFGLTEEDIGKGYNIFSGLAPEELVRAKTNLKIILAESSGSGEDYNAMRKDGTIFPVTAFISVINQNDKPIGFRGIVVDITKRKETEVALRESEAKYRAIIDAFPDIIMISDLKGNIIFGNGALERLTGITPDDYNNPDRKPHIHPDDLKLVKSYIKQLINSDSQHLPLLENRYIDANGKLHWFSGIISKIYIGDKLHLQTISRDITAKKEVENELEQYKNHLEMLIQERTEELESANDELKSTNDELYRQREELEATLNKLQTTYMQLIQSEKMASLGVLSAGIAHEINNPLNFIKAGILGLEEYIQDNIEEHSGQLKPMTEGIHSGVDRAANIVSSLKHYSRKENDKHLSCDIHSIINHCLTILHNQFKYKVEIHQNYTSQQYNVNCNEGKLHQAILNILDNAGQSIDEKGIITITTTVEKKYFRISIKDNGCGIKVDDLDKITDPFFSTKDPGKGTGLGLSITQNIIEEHQGTLVFNSEYLKGTEVIISLPMDNLNS